MGKYGEAALLAVETLRNGANDPAEAWRDAVRVIFPESPSSQNKACPRGAFLGLHTAGSIRGVLPPSISAAIGVNGKYAVCAASLLANNPELVSRGKAVLWAQVMERTGSQPSKQHNGQMDVVITLSVNGMLAARH